MASLSIQRFCLGVMTVALSGGAFGQVEMWSRQVQTVGGGGAMVLAVPASGGIYAAGHGGPVGGGAWVGKYDPSGNELWRSALAGDRAVRITGLAIDGGGAVFVTGTTKVVVPGSSAGVEDAVLLKLAPNGKVLWERQFGTAGKDLSAAIALDSAGAVYLAGSTAGALEGPNCGGADVFVRKFDSEGNLLWTRQTGTPLDEEITSLAVHPDGDIFAAGRTRGSLGASNLGGMDIFLQKLDASGQVQWSRQWGTDSDDAVRRLVVDQAGELTLSGSLGGSEFVERLDGSGARRWIQKLESAATVDGLVPDGLGGVFVTGRMPEDEGAESIFVRRYDPDGELAWQSSRIVPGRGEIASLAVDRQGSVYAAAMARKMMSGNAEESDCLITKYGRHSTEIEILDISTVAEDVLSRLRITYRVTSPDGASLSGRVVVKGPSGASCEGAAPEGSCELAVGDLSMKFRAVYAGDAAHGMSETVRLWSAKQAVGESRAAGGWAERLSTIAGDTANGYIYTIAGNGIQGYSGDGGAATSAKLSGPSNVALDSAGNVYIADRSNHRIRKLNAVTGVIATVAGNGTSGSSGNGGPATLAQLNYPNGVAVDGLGNLLIADTYNQWIRKVDAATGIITAIAGTGSPGYSGDGGAATSATFSYPYGVTVDGLGHLYIADYYNVRVRKVDAVTGVITTVAGTGTEGYSGDGGAATSAEFSRPVCVAVDTSRNLYIVDQYNTRIRKVDSVTGTITTVAGNGQYGFSGDGGAATSAQLSYPTGVTVDGLGHLYIADRNSNRIRKVDASTQVITTIAGGSYGNLGDGGPAIQAQLGSPSGVAVDSAGNVYIADTSNSRIRFVDYTTPKVVLAQSVETLGASGGTASVTFTIEPAGSPWTAQTSAAWLTLSLASGSGGTTLGYSFTANPTTIDRAATITINGMKYTVTQRGAQATLSSNVVTVNSSAGSGSFGLTVTPSASWTATSSAAWLVVNQPSGNGNATITYSYTANPGANARLATIVAGGQPFAVVQIGTSGAYTAFGPVGNGNVITIAGNGTAGYSGNGGAATSAQINYAASVAVDRSGNVFIADSSNHVIRKVDQSTGVISTIAGTGSAGSGGDGGAAIAAQLEYPNAIAVDHAGNVYIGARWTYRIRKVDAATGVITTIAGTGSSDYAGDGGPATAAQLSETGGVAVDKSGNLYIGDVGNYRIRKVDAATGVIATIAGTGTSGYTGDGGPATSAQIGQARGIAVDGMGNVYFTDESVGRIRKIDAATGLLTPVAVGIPSPKGVAVDSAGNVYLTGGNQVRKLNAATANITTIAGDGISGYYGDGGAAIWAQFGGPSGLAVDGAGNVYVADTNNHRVRFLDSLTPKITLARAEERVSATAAAGSISFTIEPAGAAWTAQSSAAWLVILNNSGTGSSTLNYAYSANPLLTQRQAIVRINGIQYSVMQLGAQVAWALNSVTVGSAAGSGTVGLTVNPAANWTATSSAAWLTVNPPSGSGSGTLTYSFLANSGTNARLAAILAGGQQFSVLQIGTSEAHTPYGTVGSGNITTIAGNGTSGYSGDGGAATSARINSPYTVAVDGSGNVYFPDSTTHRVRKVDATTRVVTTIAGDGTPGSLGDGSLAIWAKLYSPCAVAVDSAGNLYIADSGNKRIRKVSGATGVITTLEGTGLAGCALALDATGSLYFVDSRNQVQRLDLATGLILAIAGNGTAGYSGDGGAATSAQLSGPGGLAVDGTGNLYIGDSGNNRIRKVAAATGVITTIAGNGQYGFSGDGAAATAASLRNPKGVALDRSGNVYFADAYNYRIRKVNASSGVVTTFAGIGCCDSPVPDGGAATLALISIPFGVALDAAGNIYIAETFGYRIRFVDFSLRLTATTVGTISPEPSTVGQAYSVAYSVTSSEGTPSGDVTVSDGTASNTCTVAAAACSITSTTIGMKTITVTYGGSGTYTGSSGAKAHTVTPDSLVPDLAIAKTHTGNFAPGQVGATYAITVSNLGTGVTGGIVTVTDIVPAGLTATAISGGGWTCTQPAGPCTRGDALAAGGSYPAITLTVNVAGSAPSTVTNIANVAVGGEINTANNQASDVTYIGNQAQFFSVTPCRIMDTRTGSGFSGAFGPPSLVGLATRSIPVPSSNCGIPYSARAYALNVTVIPKTPSLAYLSIWPAGQTKPNVSTLNSWDGSVLANAAIVPAGTSGAINVFATDNADLVIDINGYFAPPAANSLMFYPLTPCRVLDTRNAAGTFGGPALEGGNARSFPLRSSACGIPASAQSYSLNVTVEPRQALGYLTVWPTGQAQPLASTLNSMDRAPLANAAIVPAGTNGAVSFYASNDTHLVVDVNGYFAPPGAGGLNFYPLAPCRVLDTRDPVGPYGGPIVNGVETRAVPVRQSACGLPATAQAYSLNITAVPPGFLAFLATWPAGLPWSGVSTLNNYKGLAVANAALVPAGTNGAVNLYVSNPSHVIMDINGYFGQ